MADNEIVVQQINSTSLQMENLPDGSTAVFDTATQSIHSLDPLAAAAFTACINKKTLPQLIEAMPQISGKPITEVDALNAISELERVGLVACSHSTQSAKESASRRSLLRVAGAATPLVLSLTSLEQSAFAQRAGSGVLATTTTTVAPTTTTTVAPTTTTTVAPTTTTTTTTTAAPTTTTTTTTTPGPGASIAKAVQFGSADVAELCVNNSGRSQLFSILGNNTHFNASSVISFSTPGISAGPFGADPTHIQVPITVAPGVAVGRTSIIITTGTEVAVGMNIISLVSCPI